MRQQAIMVDSTSFSDKIQDNITLNMLIYQYINKQNN